MIRPGTSSDAFALVDILKERHPETRYADIPINEKIARTMFAQAAQRHGGRNDGATFLMVSDRDGVEAFMFGALSRIYMVGELLGAADVFLLGKRGIPARTLTRLIDEYIAWAESSPKVVEIGLSWADSIPGNESIIKAYERRGFTLYGKSYRRTVAPLEMEAAA